ncbi:MAG: ZIP family metal transporter [Gaiella sp.]|nr:ZIP family metal transporter [Gaiella sp.]
MTWTTFAGLVLPGLATGLGGLGVLAVPHPGDRLMAALLGFTGGIMLAAAVFSLLVPALAVGSLAEVLAGFAAGAAAIALLDALIPHAHARFAERPRSIAGSRSLLLLSALTIHNVPEGLAVGVAFAAGGTDLGLPVAIAIGAQNVPEGFAAASPLLESGTARITAVGVAVATGLVEPPAALFGYGAAELSATLLPLGLAFAAGAMIYVVVDELVPESHSRGFERVATFGLVAGFGVMMALDNAFG